MDLELPNSDRDMHIHQAMVHLLNKGAKKTLTHHISFTEGATEYRKTHFLQAATTGSLLFNIIVEYSVFVIAFGL